MSEGPSAWDHNTFRETGRRRDTAAREARAWRHAAGLGHRQPRRPDRRLSGRWDSRIDRR